MSFVRTVSHMCRIYLYLFHLSLLSLGPHPPPLPLMPFLSQPVSFMHSWFSSFVFSHSFFMWCIVGFRVRYSILGEGFFISISFLLVVAHWRKDLLPPVTVHCLFLGKVGALCAPEHSIPSHSSLYSLVLHSFPLAFSDFSGSKIVLLCKGEHFAVLYALHFITDVTLHLFWCPLERDLYVQSWWQHWSIRMNMVIEKLIISV